MKTPNGCYQGQWLGGNKHGHGVFTYTNGDQYLGQWEQDVQHGEGTMIDAASGKEMSGIFSQGQPTQWFSETIEEEGVMPEYGEEEYG